MQSFFEASEVCQITSENKQKDQGTQQTDQE